MPDKMQFLFKHYRLVSLLLVSALFFPALNVKPVPLEKVLAGFGDIKLQLRKELGLAPTADPRVIVVEVDEPSVNRLGRWPWDRKILARLFGQLRSASIIGLDIVFSEHTDTAADMALSSVIAENGNIVLGFFLRDKATQVPDQASLDVLEECAYRDVQIEHRQPRLKEFPYIETNIASIAEAGTACAFFTTEPAPDGVYRHYPISYLYKGFFYPPLAVQMLRYYENHEPKLTVTAGGISSFRSGQVTLGAGNYFRLNAPTQVQSVSAYDIFSSKIPSEYFKDKLVIVGVTETGVFDLRPTPLDPVAPGVYRHYAALSNLLQGNPLVEVPLLRNAVLLAGFGAVFAISLIGGLYRRISLYVFSLAAVFVSALLMLLYADVWLDEFYIILAMLLFALTLEIIAFSITGAEARELKGAFSSYVSPELMRDILADPSRLCLGGEEKEISILFSDLRNFTSMSEALSPADLVSLLNDLFDPMTLAILENRGMLDKYIGDAMMALFNSPVEVPDHAARACVAALRMLDIKAQQNRIFRENGLPEIDIGIGINTGIAIVGNMGSTVRFSYTAIGDSVNLASRLEGMNKFYGTHVIVSESTRQQAGNGFLFRPLDRITVKGKKDPVAVYELMTARDNAGTVVDRFAEALDQYYAGRFDAAARLFAALADDTADGPSQVFAKRCREYITSPPPAGWDGIHHMTSK